MPYYDHHDADDLNLPDDIYEVIRSFAEVKRIPFGQAVAELVPRGLG